MLYTHELVTAIVVAVDSAAASGALAVIRAIVASARDLKNINETTK